MNDGEHYKDKSLLSQVWYSDLSPKETACKYSEPFVKLLVISDRHIKKKTDFSGNKPFIDIEEDGDEDGRSMKSRTEEIQ